MRTKLGMVVVLAVGALLVGACSDDGAGGSEDDGGSAGSLEEALAGDPSLENCQEAVRTYFDRVEIPEGFDPSDGVDDDEIAAAEAELEAAAEGLFDPSDEDHPCGALLNGMSPADSDALMSDIDPEVLELLSALAQPRFEEIEDGL